MHEVYNKQIHRSLISKGKREASYKHIGYGLNDDIEELYALMKKVSEDENLLLLSKTKALIDGNFFQGWTVSSPIMFPGLTSPDRLRKAGQK